METTFPSDTERVAAARRIAMGVRRLQMADALLVHAARDWCTTCINTYFLLVTAAAADVPAELLVDDDWVYRHVTSPGTRLAAKVDDAMREGAHRGW